MSEVCDGCGHQFGYRERGTEDHVVRFPRGLQTRKEDRERYCTPECFVENYDDGKTMSESNNGEYAMDWAAFQRDVGEWAEENFGPDQPFWYCSKGMFEEYGELIHSDLKRDQGIRLDEDDVGEAAERDAVGDITIYCCDYLYRANHQHFDDRVTISDALTEFDSWRTWHDKDGALRAVGSAISILNDDEIGTDQALVGVSMLFNALRSFCEHKGYDFEKCVSDAWEGEVSQREWDAADQWVGA